MFFLNGNGESLQILVLPLWFHQCYVLSSKMGVKIFGFLTDGIYCHIVDCELAMQLDHMCHYQMRAQDHRTLSILQGFSALCNLHLSLHWAEDKITRKLKASSQCSTLQSLLIVGLTKLDFVIWRVPSKGSKGKNLKQLHGNPE